MSYRMAISFGGRTIENREFEQEKVVVGRAENCEVRIDNLGVSRHHCEVVKEGGFYVLRDLRSNNGTYVNGKRVSVHNLNDGDEIHIGKFTLTFMSDLDDLAGSDVKKPAEDFGGGMTLQIDKNLMDLRQKERSTTLRAHLRVTHKGESRVQTVFLDRPVFTIGKDPQCDLFVPGWFTRPKHAIIFRDENGFRLIDTSQKNRTFVNGNPIDDERLKDGDAIRIGKSTIQFKVGAPT